MSLPDPATPLSYLHTVGPAGDPVTRLGWGLGTVSVAVIVTIAILLLGAILRRRARGGEHAMPEVRREGDGMRWIYIGVGVSSVVLLACAIWTLVTLAAVARPLSTPGFTVRVPAASWGPI